MVDSTDATDGAPPPNQTEKPTDATADAPPANRTEKPKKTGRKGSTSIKPKPALLRFTRADIAYPGAIPLYSNEDNPDLPVFANDEVRDYILRNRADFGPLLDLPLDLVNTLNTKDLSADDMEFLRMFKETQIAENWDVQPNPTLKKGVHGSRDHVKYLMPFIIHWPLRKVHHPAAKTVIDDSSRDKLDKFKSNKDRPAGVRLAITNLEGMDSAPLPAGIYGFVSGVTFRRFIFDDDIQRQLRFYENCSERLFEADNTHQLPNRVSLYTTLRSLDDEEKEILVTRNYPVDPLRFVHSAPPKARLVALNRLWWMRAFLDNFPTLLAPVKPTDTGETFVWGHSLDNWVRAEFFWQLRKKYGEKPTGQRDSKGRQPATAPLMATHEFLEPRGTQAAEERTGQTDIQNAEQVILLGEDDYMSDEPDDVDNMPADHPGLGGKLTSELNECLPLLINSVVPSMTRRKGLKVTGELERDPRPYLSTAQQIAVGKHFGTTFDAMTWSPKHANEMRQKAADELHHQTIEQLVEETTIEKHFADLQRKMATAYESSWEGTATAYENMEVVPSTGKMMKVPDQLIGLMHHQVLGMDWMTRQEDSMLAGGIVADDCGLGKTIQTLAFLANDAISRIQETPDGPFFLTVVAVPQTVIAQWVRDWRQIAPTTLNVRILYSDPKQTDKDLSTYTMGGSEREITKELRSLRTNDPLTQRTIILTSHATATTRLGETVTVSGAGRMSIKARSRKIKEVLILATKQQNLGAIEIPDPDDPNADEDDNFWRVKSFVDELDNIGRVIVDEGHVLKNQQTCLAKFVNGCGAQRKWVLTATPVITHMPDFIGYLIMFYQPVWDIKVDADITMVDFVTKFNPKVPWTTPAGHDIDPSFIRDSVNQLSESPGEWLREHAGEHVWDRPLNVLATHEISNGPVSLAGYDPYQDVISAEPDKALVEIAPDGQEIEIESLASLRLRWLQFVKYTRNREIDRYTDLAERYIDALDDDVPAFLLDPTIFTRAGTMMQWEPGKLSEFFPRVLSMIQLKRTMHTPIAPPEPHGPVKICGDLVPPVHITFVTLPLNDRQRQAFDAASGPYLPHALSCLSDMEKDSRDQSLAESKVGFGFSIIAHIQHAAFDPQLDSVTSASKSYLRRKNKKIFQKNRNKGTAKDMPALYNAGSDLGVTWKHYQHARDFDFPWPYPVRDLQIKASTIQSPKLQYCVSLLSRWVIEQGEKAIVFVSNPLCQWDLQGILVMLGLRVVSLVSQIKGSERRSIVDEFNAPSTPTSSQVLLCSSRLSALGLNFQQGAAKMLILEMPMTFPTLIQQIGRIHRLGARNEQEVVVVNSDNIFDRYVTSRAMLRYHSLVAGYGSYNHLEESQRGPQVWADITQLFGIEPMKYPTLDHLKQTMNKAESRLRRRLESADKAEERKRKLLEAEQQMAENQPTPPSEQPAPPSSSIPTPAPPPSSIPTVALPPSSIPTVVPPPSSIPAPAPPTVVVDDHDVVSTDPPPTADVDEEMPPPPTEDEATQPVPDGDEPGVVGTGAPTTADTDEEMLPPPTADEATQPTPVADETDVVGTDAPPTVDADEDLPPPPTEDESTHPAPVEDIHVVVGADPPPTADVDEEMPPPPTEDEATQPTAVEDEIQVPGTAEPSSADEADDDGMLPPITEDQDAPELDPGSPLSLSSESPGVIPETPEMADVPSSSPPPNGEPPSGSPTLPHPTETEAPPDPNPPSAPTQTLPTYNGDVVIPAIADVQGANIYHYKMTAWPWPTDHPLCTERGQRPMTHHGRRKRGQQHRYAGLTFTAGKAKMVADNKTTKKGEALSDDDDDDYLADEPFCETMDVAFPRPDPNYRGHMDTGGKTKAPTKTQPKRQRGLDSDSAEETDGPARPPRKIAKTNALQLRSKAATQGSPKPKASAKPSKNVTRVPPKSR